MHRHGPCSHLTSGKATTIPYHDDILRRDQVRVDSIHSKLSNNLISSSMLTDLPAKQWGNPSSGTYVVKIGIGTPKQDMSLMFDTGSDLTWVQCKPCDVYCYTQKEPIFNPSSSSSYHNVSCSSPVCSLTKPGSFSWFCICVGSVPVMFNQVLISYLIFTCPLDLVGVCSASTCGYNANYADNSNSRGFIAKEKFTLTDSDVFDDVNFGCGENNTGDYYDGVAGLLGLGPGELSFPSQTAKTYNNIFSYCLPSSSSYTGGHLTFGSAGISKSVKFTPISSLQNKSFYGLNIVGITVCDKQLEIPPTVFSTPGAIIDSGTVITRLPPKAYAALKSAFMEKMLNYAITPSGDSELDTCYDFTGLETVTIPKIAFSFSGGTVVELDPKGILYPSNERSKVCLGFAGNRDDSDAAIFGSLQHQTLQVVYDRVGGRVGFAPNGCS